MSPPRRRAALSLIALALALALVPAAGAAKKKPKNVIKVRPGPDAIQRAIDRAKPGATLRIQRGHYPEAIVIDKAVRLVAAGKVRPVIDGECGTRYTIAVRHNGVLLRRLRVIGAAQGFGPYPAEVDFSFVERGRAQGLVLRDTCEPGAEYGINVFQTGGVELLRNQARGGFTDAGIYVGAITRTDRPLLVRQNQSFGNNRGVIVEQIAADTDVRVSFNVLRDNTLPGPYGPPTGLYYNAASGTLAWGNTISGNAANGVYLNSLSSGNVLRFNRVTGNGNDLLDEGSGNCGSSNVFGTGGPLAAC